MPALPDSPSPRPRPNATAAAVLGVSRLMAAATEPAGTARVAETLVELARELLGVEAAALLSLEAPARHVEPATVPAPITAVPIAGAAPAAAPLAVHDVPPLAKLFEQRRRSVAVSGDDARALAATLSLPLEGPSGAVLLLGLPAGAPTHVLVLADPPSDAVAAAEALADAAAQALARAADAEAEARRVAAHESLTRAAKGLHESLDLPTVLNRLCEEATRILDGDYTAVYRGTRGGVVIDAAHGLPPELVGFRLEPGQGLSGKVLTEERPMLTNDYASVADMPPDSPFADIRSCIAVPMSWDGELRGVVTVGYRRPFRVTEDHLRLLETFAELATVACSNASAHAGLALAARTDGLTGCLNHAALHESLRREIERAERSATGALSLVMIDLDDFKSVNEQHGHLVGDEVLRRAGHALRQATRPYDVAARYGGDEFALLAVEADEAAADEIARRAIERITEAIGDLSVGDAGRATAGVAEWHPGLSPTELVAHADRALLFGKHEEGRGETVLFSSLPDWFRPGRFARRGRQSAAAPVPPPVPAWPAAARPTEERLRDRTRQLARASALGTRLVGMAEPARILTTAAEELGRTLGGAACTVLQRQDDRALPVPVAGAEIVESDVALAERCLAEGRPVLVTDASAPARLAVPLKVATAVWGAVVAVAAKPGGLNEDDLHLAEVVVGHAGAALHAALRYAALRLAYDEAVAALAQAREGNGAPA